MTVGDLNRFWEKWLSPAGFLVVMGGIIWGIQLNFGMISLVESVSTIAQDLKQTDERVDALEVSQAKTTIILDNLLAETRSLETRYEEHVKEYIRNLNNHGRTSP